jgi:hypothetical protein
MGAVFTPKRKAPRPFSPRDYGYNQVFQQLFEAYEQRLSNKAAIDIQKNMLYILRKKYGKNKSKTYS